MEIDNYENYVHVPQSQNQHSLILDTMHVVTLLHAFLPRSFTAPSFQRCIAHRETYKRKIHSQAEA